MKLVIRIFLLIAVLTSSVFASDYKPADRKPVEFTERGGLPNFFKKAREGKDVTIVYFGGSITAQHGWRLQSEAYFKKHFPKAKFNAVHSAIGGTGSLLGTFRTQRDVIAHNPDLLFIEFAVNDSGQKPWNIRNTMEGIIRQVWKANPKTDICFVYTITDSDRMLGAHKQGKTPESSAVMEDIANYYKIPSIDFGVKITELESANKLIMRAPGGKMTAVSGDSLNDDAIMTKDKQGRIIFAKDGVHPYPSTGHIFYTRTLINAFEKMENSKHAFVHKMPKPLSADNFEKSNRINSDDTRIKYTGNNADNPNVKYYKRNIDTLRTLHVGASMKFKVKTKSLYILHLMGTNGCVVDIYIDGKKHNSLRTFDGYCTYSRLQISKIFDFAEDKVREVELRVTDQKLDKRKLLFERNHEHFDKNPDVYNRYWFEPAAIMFVGEMLD